MLAVQTVNMCSCNRSCAATKHLTTVCTRPLSITIFDDRCIQTALKSFHCVSGNRTSSWENEIKRGAVVIDSCVSWFGAGGFGVCGLGGWLHRERGDSASGCHNPFSFFSLCISLCLPPFSLNPPLYMSLLISHLSELGHWHREPCRR